jgi:hypothetical protein
MPQAAFRPLLTQINAPAGRCRTLKMNMRWRVLWRAIVYASVIFFGGSHDYANPVPGSAPLGDRTKLAENLAELMAKQRP